MGRQHYAVPVLGIMVAALFVLRAVDPGYVIEPTNRLILGAWSYLEFALLILGAVFIYAAAIWLRRTIALGKVRQAVLLVAACIAIALLVSEIHSQVHRHFASAGDALFDQVRRGQMEGRLEYAKAAESRKAELLPLITDASTSWKRIRALPRYSIYEYEGVNAKVVEPVFVSMTLEGRRPTLEIGLKVDRSPSFQ